MTPYYSDEAITIYNSDVLAALRELPDKSVQCIVTSPPYWGLRDYGIPPSIWGGDAQCSHEWSTELITTEIGKGNWAQAVNGRGEHQPGGLEAKREPMRATAKRAFCSKCGAWLGSHGLEPTPELYVKNAVMIFREARRVLRDDGTLWGNWGDTFAANRSYQVPDSKWQDVGNSLGNNVPNGLKPKDLVGIPWRVALALQADGWYLRCDIIFSKTNAMPESVKDRPSKSHEYLFLLAKSEHYYYDADAIKEPVPGTAHRRASFKTPDGGDTSVGDGGHGNFHKKGREKGHTNYIVSSPKQAVPGNGIKNNSSFNSAIWDIVDFRNKRSVWAISTEAFPDCHFATFPTALVKPCILAGTSAAGCCSICGKPYVRVVENIRAPRGDRFGKKDVGDFDHGQAESSYMKIVGSKTVGWKRQCDCPGGKSVPCVVADIFAGSGTTLQVAQEFGRKGIGIELNPDYCQLIKKRTAQTALILR